MCHVCKRLYSRQCSACRALDPMPLNPGVRRVGSIHLKQPRRPKPKPAAAAQTSPDTANGIKTSKPGRGRKRRSSEAAEADEAAETTASQPSGGKSGNGRGRRGVVKTEPSSVKGSRIAESAASAAKQPREGYAKEEGGKGRKKIMDQQAQELDPQLEDDVAAACAASLADAHQNCHGSPSRPQKAKRLGDIQLENQLAMALASTAAEAQHKIQRKPSASAVHNEPMPSAFSPKPAAAAKPTLGETWARDARLPKQDLGQGEAASHWAEVFCGSTELGKWIHVDPLLNWVDMPDKVEGAGIR